MRKYRFFLCAAVCAALGVFAMGMGEKIHAHPKGQNQGVDDLFRMHFVAHSDGAYDQAVKLQVRDEVLSVLGPELSAARTAREAMRIAQGMQAVLEDRAQRALIAGGVGYGARLVIDEMDFEDREYEGAIVPAGRYPALRLELGAAQGQNWWCVLYPSACAQADVPSKDNTPGFHSLIWDWFCGLGQKDKVGD